MPPTTGVKTPQALAETRRWAAPGSKSAALFAQAQGVMPGGNTRPGGVYLAPASELLPGSSAEMSALLEAR